MRSIPRHWRHPRRFFGDVVRRLRRRESNRAGVERRRRRNAPTDAERAVQSERARFAAKLDLELRLACRGEAAMRRELGDAARAFIRARAYGPLGFVRLSDYARERLGVSARALQEAAWLATRLDSLPAISSAYDRSELSWAAARAICRVAVPADEAQWLAVARRSTVEALERLVARTRRPDDVPPDPQGEPNEIDGEPAVRWRFACPSRVRALWRRALELASRVAGGPLADWRGAEIIAAEGSSGCPRGASMGDRVLIEAIRQARRERRRHAARVAAGDATCGDARGESAAPPACSGGAGEAAHPLNSDISAAIASASDATPAVTPHRGAVPPPTDPVSLEARLAEAMRVLRTIEPRIGRLLRVVIDQHLHRSFSYRTFEDYVRERLGISVRKAWALLKIEKAVVRSADFDRAYRDGSLSWVRALSLLPVLDRSTAPAWIARAEAVTVRRLADEVEWVLASRDALGPSFPLAPPPIDGPLPAPIVATPPNALTTRDECRNSSPHARLQIRAYQDLTTATEIVDAEIRFTGPASVVALLRDVLDAFAESGEPRWRAFERLLRHVITHWESTPRHPDPVFARDGWRCTVPACSSRRNLHDHHIRFRSRGGDNRRDNRTTVCAAHHLHGIHAGTVRATGIAPYAIEWQLGVRPGAPPFLTYVGDRLCVPDVTTRKVLTSARLDL